MKFPFKIIDLTHPLTENIPSWDKGCGFHHDIQIDYTDCDTDVKFRVQTIRMPAGLGTHMDAPAHCYPSGKTIDAFSLQDCLAPCVVIDISVKADENYRCSVKDILNFESCHGEIKSGDFVIVRTGWERFWSTPNQYRNSLRFPSIAKEVAELFLKRDISGLGIDTLSPDTENSGYPVHQIILGKGKYLVENVANASMLPAKGSYIFVVPLLIAGATEAPVRLIGFIK